MLISLMDLESGSHDPVMVSQDRGVGVIAESPQEIGRSLDVGKEKGQRLDLGSVRKNPLSRWGRCGGRLIGPPLRAGLSIRGGFL